MCNLKNVFHMEHLYFCSLATFIFSTNIDHIFQYTLHDQPNLYCNYNIKKIFKPIQLIIKLNKNQIKL